MLTALVIIAFAVVVSGSIYLYTLIVEQIEKSNLEIGIAMRAKRIKALYKTGKEHSFLTTSATHHEGLVSGFKPHVGHLKYDDTRSFEYAWQVLMIINNYNEGQDMCGVRNRYNRDLIWDRLVNLGLVITESEPHYSVKDKDTEYLLSFFNDTFSPRACAEGMILLAAKYLGLKKYDGAEIDSYRYIQSEAQEYFTEGRNAVVRRAYDKAIAKQVSLTKPLLEVFKPLARMKIVLTLLGVAKCDPFAQNDDIACFKKYVDHILLVAQENAHLSLTEADGNENYHFDEDYKISLMTLHKFRFYLAEYISNARFAQNNQHAGLDYKLLVDLYYDLVNCLCTLSRDYKYAYETYGDDYILSYDETTSDSLRYISAGDSKAWKLGNRMFDRIVYISGGQEGVDIRGDANIEAIKYEISKLNASEKKIAIIGALVDLHSIYMNIASHEGEYYNILWSLHNITVQKTRVNKLLRALFEEGQFEAFVAEHKQAGSIYFNMEGSILTYRDGQPVTHLSTIYDQLGSERNNKFNVDIFQEAMKPYPEKTDLFRKCFARHNYHYSLSDVRRKLYNDKLCRYDEFVTIVKKHFDYYKELYDSNIYSETMRDAIKEVNRTLNLMSYTPTFQTWWSSYERLGYLHYKPYMRIPVIRAALNPDDKVDDHIRN